MDRAIIAKQNIENEKITKNKEYRLLVRDVTAAEFYLPDAPKQPLPSAVLRQVGPG